MGEPSTPPPVWDDALLANPHAAADKRTRVQRMFSAIAPSYDLNNRLHSLWQDQNWREFAVRSSGLRRTDVVVDVACGTGDLAIAFAGMLLDSAAFHLSPPAGQVIGVDFTYEMLPLARSKSSRRFGAHDRIRWVCGDAMSLPLPDRCADVVSIAFGIRNVADPAGAMREFRRVLRPGGRLIILEFSLPTSPVLRRLYNFYFRSVLPRTATLISGDRTGAYRYLPESVQTFIGREAMARMMAESGFREVNATPLTFGVCVCYRGVAS